MSDTDSIQCPECDFIIKRKWLKVKLNYGWSKLSCVCFNSIDVFTEKGEIMEQSNKEIKRIKRAYKNGARVQIMINDWENSRIRLRFRGYSNNYRIHPDDEHKFDHKGRKYLNADELVKGEWYHQEHNTNTYTLQFDDISCGGINRLLYFYMVNNLETTFQNSRMSLSGRYVKASKKQIKSAKKLLGIDNECRKRIAYQDLKIGNWCLWGNLVFQVDAIVNYKICTPHSVNIKTKDIETINGVICSVEDKIVKATKKEVRKAKEIYKNRNLIIEIKAGDRFECVEDVIMNPCNTIAFSKGGTYESRSDDTIVNNSNIDHYVSMTSGFKNKHFRKLPPLKTKEEIQDLYTKHPELIPDDFPSSEWFKGMKVHDAYNNEYEFKEHHVNKNYCKLNPFNQLYELNKLYPYPVKVTRA